MIDSQEVTLSVNKQKIRGTLLVPRKKGNLPAVVFFHGKNSSRQSYLARATAITEQAIIAFCFDFRGCGQSEGESNKLTLSDALDDALSAYDFLITQPFIDKDRIGICGASLGGYLAVLVSQQRKVESLVLRAPAIYKQEWHHHHLPQLSVANFTNKDFKNNRAIKAIENFSGSLLIIECEKDEIIPQKIIREYFSHAISAKQTSLFTIKKATHVLTNPNWNQQFIEQTVNWFKDTL